MENNKELLYLVRELLSNLKDKIEYVFCDIEGNILSVNDYEYLSEVVVSKMYENVRDIEGLPGVVFECIDWDRVESIIEGEYDYFNNIQEYMEKYKNRFDINKLEQLLRALQN